MNGFAIKLNLPFTPLTGLNAVDFRRRFGLPDAASVTFAGILCVDDVPETVVRTWFPPSACVASVTIRTDWLFPGELTAGDGESVVLTGIDVERASELFVRAKCEELQKDLENAERQLIESERRLALESS